GARPEQRIASRPRRSSKKRPGESGRSTLKMKYATSVGSFRLSGNSSVTCWDNYASRMVLGLNRIGTASARKTSSFFPSGTSFYAIETNFNEDWTAHERTSHA